MIKDTILIAVFSLAAAQGKLKGQSRQDFNSVSQKIQQKYLYPLKLRTKYTVWHHEILAGSNFYDFSAIRKSKFLQIKIFPQKHTPE